MSRAIHVYVIGRVQQVGYRQNCRRKARSLDLVGWVRNLSDGRVELFAQGESEAIDHLVAWTWAGRSSAVVAGVESDNVAPDQTLSDFFIQPNLIASDTAESSGFGSLNL